MTAIHRIWQGTGALLAFARPVDYALAQHYLSPPQLTLFRGMRRSEQLHSLNVLRDVMAQTDEVPDDLAVAALLHDVGKSRYPLAIWQKTIAVLVRAFLPALFRQWSAGDPSHFWTRAFAVAVHHSAWSAEMVAQAGASERLAWLIAHHANSATVWDNHPFLPLLIRLQQADDAN